MSVSKHFDLGGHRVGLHVAYRDWQRERNSSFDGVVGGLTYQPSFQRNLRFIAEYTGNDVNVGVDWKLWKYLLIQSSLQNGKYFSWRYMLLYQFALKTINNQFIINILN